MRQTYLFFRNFSVCEFVINYVVYLIRPKTNSWPWTWTNSYNNRNIDSKHTHTYIDKHWLLWGIERATHSHISPFLILFAKLYIRLHKSQYIEPMCVFSISFETTPNNNHFVYIYDTRPISFPFILYVWILKRLKNAMETKTGKLSNKKL